MPRILKIDNFSHDFKSKYGLEAGGTCYIVKEPFYIEIVSSYDVKEVGKTPILNSTWSKIELDKDDIISVTDSGCFAEIKGYDGFIECRPEKTSKDNKGISFDVFPKELLEKIGKSMISSPPMTFEERKKLSLSRI